MISPSGSVYRSSTRVWRQVVHAAERAAALLAQLHDRADVLARRDDHRLDDRLVGLGDLHPARPVRRIGDDVLGAVLEDHPVDDVRRGADQVEVELALEPVSGDLQVQQAEEAAAETEAERGTRLRLVDQRRVVEPQPVEGVAQQRVVRPVQRIKPGVDHRPGVAIAAERFAGRLGGVGDGVADARLADVLHPGDQVADLADAQALGRFRFGRDDADLHQLVGRTRRHHLDPLARGEVPVDHPDVGDHAAVDVVHGVEDHRSRRRIGVADRGRDVAADDVEQFLDALARLGADSQHVVGLAADDVRESRPRRGPAARRAGRSCSAPG